MTTVDFLNGDVAEGPPRQSEAQPIQPPARETETPKEK